MAKKPRLVCDQPAAKAIYEHLMALDRAGTFPKGLKLDAGYRVLDYANFSKRKGHLKGENDGQVQCQELWENVLKVLDALGEEAAWEEDTKAAENETHRKAIERYQDFRKLVECGSEKAISWVFEAPYLCGPGNSLKNEIKAARDETELGRAKTVRDRVRQAIRKLETLLSDLKEKNVELFKERMIVGLYWFTWMAEKVGQAAPQEDAGKERGVFFEMGLNFFREKISQVVAQFKYGLQLVEMINSLEQHGLRGFAEYLLEEGGLGMSMAREDAPLEASALKVVTEREVDPQTGFWIKRGWCTEQSKVLYAVLRMAGIRAFFVDPYLTASYLKRKNILDSILVPLPGHTATGVGVEIEDKDGNKKMWVLDVTLRMLHADYISDRPRAWETNPFWELSLRHYWMVDLSNLASGHAKAGDKEKAEEYYQFALQLGEDSTAYYAFGNYGYLLCNPLEELSIDSKECESAHGKIEKSLKIYPKASSIQWYQGEYLSRKARWVQAVGALLESIAIDPRSVIAYRSFGLLLCNIRLHAKRNLPKVLKRFERSMRRIIQTPPGFQNEVKVGLDVLKQEIARGFEEFEKRVREGAAPWAADTDRQNISWGLKLSRGELLNEISKMEKRLGL